MSPPSLPKAAGPLAGLATTAVFASLWYSTSMLATTTAKLTMQAARVPLLLCCVQFACAALITRVVAFARGQRLGSLGDEKWVLTVISTGFTLGFLCTNWALTMAHAPFVETVKACEPISTVILAYLLLGEVHATSTYASLLLVASGVALASTGKAGGNFAAFLLTMGSNCNFSVRAVVAKRLKRDYPDSALAASDVSLFYHVSCVGLVTLLLPLLICWASTTEVPILLDALSSGLLLPGRFLGTAFFNGAMYTSYNLFSLMVLSRVSAATHSLLNVCRRVCVICVTALFFGVELSALNMMGVLISVLGMVLFTLSKSWNVAKASAILQRWKHVILRLHQENTDAFEFAKEPAKVPVKVPDMAPDMAPAKDEETVAIVKAADASP